MGIGVLLEVVDLGLLVVTEIGQAQCPFWCAVPIHRGELAEGGGRNKSGGYDVMIVVAPRKDFVVALSVVGTEHHAYQWQVEFVTGCKTMTTDVETVRSSCTWHDVECSTSLGGVVAAGHVVDGASAEVGGYTSLQFQTVKYRTEIVVACPIEIVSDFQIVDVMATVVGVREVDLVLIGVAPTAGGVALLFDIHVGNARAAKVLGS